MYCTSSFWKRSRAALAWTRELAAKPEGSIASIEVPEILEILSL
jgi:hypothetical protein